MPDEEQQLREVVAERDFLRRVLDSLPAGVWARNAAGDYMVSNRERQGQRQRHRAQDLAQISELESRVLATGRPATDPTRLLLGPGGEMRFLTTTLVPLGEDGVVGVGTDMTEHIQTAEQLRSAAAELERSNRELAEFAAIASHDLQEPLRKIQAFGDRLRKKHGAILPAEGHDYLERMESAATRMRVLIEDLLTLSRVTSRGRKFVEVDLAELVQGVLSDLEVSIERSGAAIEIGYLPRIEGDPAQLRQLFQNLISNALKFHKPGQPPVVSLSAKIRENQEHHLAGAAPGDRVCQIVCQDSGIGFSGEQAEKIFGIFQRLHSRQEYEGSGIGLAVCRRIADRHGGAVYAKSSQDEGATFVVTLPLKQAGANVGSST